MFLVPGVVKKDLENLPALFAGHLRTNLLLDGIPGAVVDRVAGEEPFHLAKTRDRSVLGSMNDLTFQCRYRIEAECGLGMDHSIRVLRAQLNEEVLLPWFTATLR